MLKLEELKSKGLVEQGSWLLGFVVGTLEKAVTGTETLGDALKGKEIARLGRQIDRIKALEELTEIAEKRGVATTLKAALANAMETTKNRGWTDYLNSLDSSKVTDAVRELIAAEKIRAWARDINNLDVDERAMVAGAFSSFVRPLIFVAIPAVLMVVLIEEIASAPSALNAVLSLPLVPLPPVLVPQLLVLPLLAVPHTFWLTA